MIIMGGYSDDLSDHCVFGLIFLQNWLTQFTQIWVLSQAKTFFSIVWPFDKLSKFTKCSLKIVLGDIFLLFCVKIVVLFLICSVLPKDHTKVIIVSAWLRTHIWVKWLSQVYRKIRPLPSVSLLFMLAWKIDFESQRQIVWLQNKMYDFGMALEAFIDTKFVKAGNNLLTFCNCNFAKWFCTFCFVSLKMICY